jgi:hypothetical protein
MVQKFLFFYTNTEQGKLPLAGSKANDVVYPRDLSDCFSSVTKLNNQVTGFSLGGPWQKTKCHLMEVHTDLEVGSGQSHHNTPSKSTVLALRNPATLPAQWPIALGWLIENVGQSYIKMMHYKNDGHEVVLEPTKESHTSFGTRRFGGNHLYPVVASATSTMASFVCRRPTSAPSSSATRQGTLDSPVKVSLSSPGRSRDGKL